METILQIGAQLGIDDTIFSLFGLVVVLYIMLSLTYLKPFQKLLHHRKEKTEGAKKEAQQLTSKAEEKFSQYKVRLKEINDKARKTLHNYEETAKKEEAKILGDATLKAKISLQNTQKELDSQRRATIEALSNEISGIANDIATKVMGRAVGPR